MPTEPDWEVNELLDAAVPAGSWGIEEPCFPIADVETITKVIWVDAENETTLSPTTAMTGRRSRLPDAQAIDGDLELRRPGKWERMEALASRVYDSKIGPQVACPAAGTTSPPTQTWSSQPASTLNSPRTKPRSSNRSATTFARTCRLLTSKPKLKQPSVRPPA
jgi:hypothetical protein